MSIFPTKILLATDGSKDAQLALRMAAELASGTNSEVHVGYVRPKIPPDYPGYYVGPEIAEHPEREEEELDKEAQSLLNTQVEKIEGAGSTAQTHLRVGRADAEIVALAEEIGAGLIVVGSRGQGEMRRALMGSVSDSVLRHAHCPVLVVRSVRREQAAASIFPTKIVLATDGSEEATLAAQTAADLALKTGSELHLVNVRPAPMYIEPTSEVVSWISSIEERERKEAQQLLDAQAEQIQALGATVAPSHVRLGRPDEEIVILAEEIGAGLIAMGSRGLGGIRRALMGSVSDSVVRHAHCPVLVVRKERQ